MSIKNNGTAGTLEIDAKVAAEKTVSVTPSLPEDVRFKSDAINHEAVKEAKSQADWVRNLIATHSDLRATKKLDVQTFAALKVRSSVKPGKNVAERAFEKAVASGKGTFETCSAKDAVILHAEDMAENGELSAEIDKCGNASLSVTSGRDGQLPLLPRLECTAKYLRDSGIAEYL